MRITAYLSSASVVPELRGGGVDGVLRELSEVLARAAPSVGAAQIYTVLSDREKAAPTAMEKGVAIPHGRMPGVADLVACFGVSHQGIAFNARDGGLSHFFFALLAPENSAGIHLKALAKVSRILRSDSLRTSILNLSSASEMYELLVQEDARTPF
jgi:PTS system nitrogen regulatory IIA component